MVVLCAHELETMLALLVHGQLSHVPTYGSGIEGCFDPPRHHDTSQVIYIRGSGGVSPPF